MSSGSDTVHNHRRAKSLLNWRDLKKGRVVGGTNIIELTAEAWEGVRNSVTQQFLGISAKEFIQNFEAGRYDEQPPEDLMEILGYFPELD